MDLTIPGGMGGKETIGKRREMDPEIKAIVSSGYCNNPIMGEFRTWFCRSPCQTLQRKRNEAVATLINETMIYCSVVPI